MHAIIEERGVVAEIVVGIRFGELRSSDLHV
jgi:hypothetical protein